MLQPTLVPSLFQLPCQYLHPPPATALLVGFCFDVFEEVGGGGCSEEKGLLVCSIAIFRPLSPISLVCSGRVSATICSSTCAWRAGRAYALIFTALGGCFSG